MRNFFSAIFERIKEEHKSSFDGYDIRDFIDAFIHEMKQMHEDDSGFTVICHSCSCAGSAQKFMKNEGRGLLAV